MKTTIAARFSAFSVAAAVIAVAVSALTYVPVAEAAPSFTAQVVDAMGNPVKGAIPPRVVLDLDNSIPAGANTNWKMVRVFNGTEFLARKTGANGYVDAGFSDTTGTVFTIDVPAGCGNASSVETEDILIKVVSQLTFGAPDAGASTVQLDVGISGTLERFAKDVDLLAAANTRVLGSATTSVKPRLIDAAPLTYRLTVTQSAKDLTTVTGGQFRVFALCGNVHEF